MPNDQGKGAHRRADRVAEAIREEVATFLTEEVKDPRVTGLVTVTGVEVTRDLRNAKVFVGVMGTDVERASTFCRATKRLSPASVRIRRFTSAKRTCSMTC